MTQRTVIAHLHLFKNAGTSVEEGLKSHFENRWLSYDKDGAGSRVSFPELVDELRGKPQIEAVSSHQLRPPLVGDEEFRLLPLLFLRHPIDRIRSAYAFERTQGADSPSSKAAATMGFVEWLDFHRSRNSAQCQNFQVFALTPLRNEQNGAPLFNRPLEEHYKLAQTFVESIPEVGLVEYYDASWASISSWLREFFPGFNPPSVHANTTIAGRASLAERMSRLELDIGAENFALLTSENAADLELHRWATERGGFA